MKLTSAVAITEAGLRLFRETGSNLARVHAEIAALLSPAEIRVIDVGQAEADAALDAYARFGKGRHPARLNMGDCFAYACARTNGVPLLFFLMMTYLLQLTRQNSAIVHTCATRKIARLRSLTRDICCRHETLLRGLLIADDMSDGN